MTFDHCAVRTRPLASVASPESSPDVRMPDVELESLLFAVAGDAPCGANLE
jgi:hypothetical protein